MHALASLAFTTITTQHNNKGVPTIHSKHHVVGKYHRGRQEKANRTSRGSFYAFGRSVYSMLRGGKPRDYNESGPRGVQDVGRVASAPSFSSSSYLRAEVMFACGWCADGLLLKPQIRPVRAAEIRMQIVIKRWRESSVWIFVQVSKATLLWAVIDFYPVVPAIL